MITDKAAPETAVSVAPPRPPVELEEHLQLMFDELKAFVDRVDGELDGDLGELLKFVRSKM